MPRTLILFDPTIPDAQMLAEAIAEGVRSVPSAEVEVRPLADGNTAEPITGYDAVLLGALKLPEALASLSAPNVVASPFGTAGSGWGLLEPLARLDCLVVPPPTVPNEPDAERLAARQQGVRVATVAAWLQQGRARG